MAWMVSLTDNKPFWSRTSAGINHNGSLDCTSAPPSVTLVAFAFVFAFALVFLPASQIVVLTPTAEVCKVDDGDDDDDDEEDEEDEEDDANGEVFRGLDEPVSRRIG
jgi:hypothetical protein